MVDLPSRHYWAEKSRVMEVEKKEREREREPRMSGPIVFPPHSGLTTGWVCSDIIPPQIPPTPPLLIFRLTKSISSKSSFIMCGYSLNSFFFFSSLLALLHLFGATCSLASARTRLCTFSPPKPLPTSLLHPHLFSQGRFVRQDIRIYKSQLAPSYTPKTSFQVTQCSVCCV